MSDEERLTKEINLFNGLAKKHDHRMQLKYIFHAVTKAGILVIGSEEQLEAGAYQAELCRGMELAYKIVHAMRIIHCAEFGE